MHFDPLILIPSFNNPSYVRGMVAQLHERACRCIRIVDNASSAPEMLVCLQQMETQGVEVLHRSENSGPRLFLDAAFYAALPEYFVITDPDLALNPQLPATFLEDLLALTEQYQIGKAGFALDISDRAALRPERFAIGDKEFTIWEWEEKFWTQPLPPLPGGDPVYNANIDTTFALYNKRYFDPGQYRRAVRVAGRFTCRHLPWYRECSLAARELRTYQKTQRYSYYLPSPSPHSWWQALLGYLRRDRTR